MSRKGKMPNLGFKMMVWTYNLIDLIHTPQKKMDRFEIQTGDVVVDYGCGPGRYVKKASQLVGQSGQVYAVDIHPLAIAYTSKLITKNNLQNVTPGLIENGIAPMEEHCADVVYALDMFHHVDNP